MSNFIKSVKSYLKYNNKSHFSDLMIGGNKVDTFEIEYDKKIKLEFKTVTDNDDINIYISNEFNYEKLDIISSCLTIKINKKYKIAYIEGISSDNFSCFNNSDFILRNESGFYLQMTIKMLKKYKEKFNINKIQLRDNAVIKLKNGLTYNLSQFKLLTENTTWYEKYGFTIDNMKIKEKYKLSKKILNKLKAKDLKFDNILRKVLIGIQDEKIINEINIILKLTDDYKEYNLINFLNNIFVINKSKIRYIIYALIIDKLLDRLSYKFNYEKYIPNTYYIKL